MRVALIIVAASIAAACAPLTPQQLEDREYRNTDWENRYVDYAHRCRRAGGRIMVQASGPMRRNGVPARSDYYQCSRSVAAAPRG